MRNPIVRPRTLPRLTARLIAVASFAALLYSPSPGWAAPAPDLGAASGFSVLAGTAVTCTRSVVTGDAGSLGAFTPTLCTITGTVHQADAVAATAYADFLGAYATLANTQCDHTISVAAFTGNVPALGPLAPGVYCFPAAVTFTDTTLTLNGPANGIWIFKVGAALTGNGFRVVMTGGGQPCNVYWSVGAAATLTTSTLSPLFQGNILVGEDISFTGVAGGTPFNGDAFAGGKGTTSVPTGAVTLTDYIVAGCGGVLAAQASCKAEHEKPKHKHCNQGVGNGPEGCDPGNSNQGDDDRSNDELNGTPGHPGRHGGNGK